MIYWTIYSKNEIIAELNSSNPKLIWAWGHQNLVDLEMSYIEETINMGWNAHIFRD